MATRKKFIDVNLAMVNESLPVLGEPETLVNKTIKLDLSRKLKGRGLEVVFQILAKDKELIAYPKNMTLMRSYITRMMRKRVNYVEDSFTSACKDIPVTIKPFLITRKKVSRAIRNNLRRTAKEFILEYTKTKTYMELAEAILFGEMQKEMYPRLKKVYPLSLCEIRVLEVKDVTKADLTISEKQKVEAKEEVEELTQAEEIELAQKAKEEAKKAENLEEKIETQATDISSEEQKEKPKKAKKKEEKKEE
jgi:ribosomal protein S3AE